MTENKELITILNTLLTDELTSINQFMVHAKICANWGYDKLYSAIRKQAIDGVHHAEWLIGRILFLDGSPMVTKLNVVMIGKTVTEILSNANGNELSAVHSYIDSIKLARDNNDQGTVDLLTKILKMEESHVDWAEMQQAQIEQFGLDNYLANQN
jgi:bacterioferritin